MRINRQKTCVSRAVAEINSTTFLKEGDRWVRVRGLRRGGGEPVTLEGVRHMSTACLNAGPKWVSAFIRSGIGKKYHIRPTDLGLPLTNLDVYHRERDLDRYVVLPPIEADLDPRLQAVYEEPSLAEVEAVRELLFNHGRYSPSLRFTQRTPLKTLEKKKKKWRFGRKKCLYVSFCPKIREDRLSCLLQSRRGIRRDIVGFVSKDWCPTEKDSVEEEGTSDGCAGFAPGSWCG
jgi:hypothetical protein